MISFDIEHVRFHYRAAGVFLREGHVLLCTVEGLDFWFIPGGRCEAMETSADAVAREVREELGMEARVGRLLWVVENFFTHAGKSAHELGLYYLMALPPDSLLLDTGRTFHGDEHGERMTYRWFPLDELERTRVYPIFLRAALQHIPDAIQHIVNVDNKEEDTAITAYT